ncbi:MULTISPECIES: hypothetical protein [Bacillaceae]|uniref:Uncharacterized protein n=1 Tax=Domibacillus aminovorans TaxID=29332 RepID=A0A177KTE8_9BACI|nr:MULTISPECIES: hypothetical protein [Bacillaceae]OAH56643.1 hypothetical protein AWH48_19970 [Domibacillus aminovorans]
MTFDELRKNKPIVQWVEEDEDGDFFTEENISATNKDLDTYIESLKELGDQPTEEEIQGF